MGVNLGGAEGVGIAACALQRVCIAVLHSLFVGKLISTKLLKHKKTMEKDVPSEAGEKWDQRSYGVPTAGRKNTDAYLRPRP